MFHIPWKPYCLTQHVEISFNKPPIKRSSDLFWLWTNTSHLLDLHATSHDRAPPRNLKLTVSATNQCSCTLDFAAKFDLVFKTSAIYIYIYLTGFSKRYLCRFSLENRRSLFSSYCAGLKPRGGSVKAWLDKF